MIQYNNFKNFLYEIGFKIITAENEYVSELKSNCEKIGKRYAKVQYKCNQNHISCIQNTVFVNKISAFKNKKITNFCASCNNENESNICIEKYYQIAKNLDYKILEIKGNGDQTVIKFVCSCGNTASTNYRNFNKKDKNSFCISCMNNKNKVKLNIVLEIFNKAGLEPIDINTYNNNKQKIECKHTCGNITKISLSEVKRGRICNMCNRIRAEQTNLQKYGAKNPMHNNDIWKKLIKNLYRSKPYYLKNNTIYIMGYEGFCLDILLQKIKTNYEGPFYTEDDVILNPKNLSVSYDDENGKTRKYYPDIFLTDKVIEVKSLYTFNKNSTRNHCKGIAAVKVYSQYEIWVLEKEKILTIIIYENGKSYFKNNGTLYTGENI